jgi:endonuclease/exonuclease/phosphatase family metal-dependent hydrolase
MRTRLLAALLALALAPGTAAAAAAPETLTVVTLNLWHDQADWPRRRAVILAGVRALAPDVICLQEVLQHAALPNQARALADSLGYRMTFASVDPDTAVKRYGNAILTRHPVLRSEGKALAPRDDYRTAAHLRIAWAGREVDVYATHLHHTAEGGAIRAEQIRDLLGFIAATRGGGPVVVAGDFNAGAGAPELSPLTEEFQDAFAATHPGAGGDTTATLNAALGHAPRRIDHIFVARRGPAALTPVGAAILFREPGPGGVWASDHFGVMARLRGPG